MKCEKLTKFEIRYRRHRIVVRAHTVECGVPERVNEMSVRIFTLLSVARLLATALFICESEGNTRFALNGKDEVRASKVKAPCFFWRRRRWMTCFSLCPVHSWGKNIWNELDLNIKVCMSIRVTDGFFKALGSFLLTGRNAIPCHLQTECCDPPKIIYGNRRVDLFSHL